MKIEMTYTRVFHYLWETQNRINAFRGGARSSKTYSICQAIAIWLISGQFGDKKYPKGNFSIVRETLPSLRASVYKDFVEVLHLMDMYQKIEHRKTTLEFAFNGREVHFFSTDDLNSAKLRGRKHTFLYINEANSGVTFEAYQQMVMRTQEFIILDYNPSGVDSWVRTFIEEEENKRKKVKLDVSTYHDNLKHLSQNIVNEIDNEFRRMAAIIADSKNPLQSVRVVVNDKNAKPFFDTMLKKYNIQGEVVIRPE